MAYRIVNWGLRRMGVIATVAPLPPLQAAPAMPGSPFPDASDPFMPAGEL